MSLFQAPDTEIAKGDSVSARIAKAARVAPEKPAIICDGQILSWRGYDARVNQVANGLRALGVQKGDTVAILARNSIAYAEIFIGAIRAGVCIVPLSTMADAQTLQRMITDSACKVLFLADGMRELLAPVLDDLPSLLPDGRLAIDFAAEGWRDYVSWRAANGDENPNVFIGPRDDFNIIYSSGTTGLPKGILHSNGIRTSLCDSFKDFGVDENAVTILSTPLYSNTTIVTFLPTLAAGGCLVLMSRFDVVGFLALVEKHRCSHTMLVPVQLQRIMAHADFGRFDLSSMQVKLSTSAPLRAALKRDIVERFPGLMIEIYGLTEGGGSAVLNCNEHMDKLESVGQPGMNTAMKIIDEEGNEVAQGELGEIVARSPAMMTGYFGRDDLTSELFWRDDAGEVYFRSGDVGRLDDDGFLFLGDRKKDMIISGGFNVYANDLELALLKHQRVADAAVVAVPSEQWGETPLAFVVLSKANGADEPLSAEDLRVWVNGNLGKAQRISAIEMIDELPRSSIGKILKRELRAPYWPD